MALSVAQRVEALALPIAQSLGFSLWDVEFKKEGSAHILRILIDKEGGVSLDDCADFSHAIDPVLDKEDPVPTQYYLEVSSAGLTRQLRREEHFAKCIGRDVDVKLYKQQNGKKLITGALLSADADKLCISENGVPTEIERKNIADVHLAVDF